MARPCFCGDHDDLCRLRIQLNEALGNKAHLTFSARRKSTLV
jgi:HMP-PP phosphatase